VRGTLASPVLLVALALAASVSFPAVALEPIADHRDQIGITFALGTAYDTAAAADKTGTYQPGFEPMVEVGVTWAVTSRGDELSLRGRFTGGGVLYPALLFGYRGYFGYDAFKTFFVADAMLTSKPFWGLGPHLGFGAQLDFGPHFGAFLQVGGAVTFGQSVFTSLDLQGGGQFRF
jgi:hypothetical protein